MMELIFWNDCASKTMPRLLGFIIAGVLGFWIQQASGQESQEGVITTKVGDTVTIGIPVTEAILVYTWYIGTAVNSDQEILTYRGPNNTETGPRYTGRETGLADGALQITDVLTNYTGNYTRNILLQAGRPITSTTQLRVYDILTAPTLVNASGSGFIGDEFTLHCQVGNQTVERYAFHKDTMNVTCDQQSINCSEHNSYLSFQPIKEADNGNYTCTIYNPVSANTSLPLRIIVKVPISNVTISSNVTSGGLLWENEDSVQLTCTAKGSEPVFSWMHNGSVLLQNSRYHLSADGSSLTISPVNREDTGSFQCIASNSANNMISATELLPISWRPNGLINCGANNISDIIQFSCSWPGGNPPASVQMVLPPIVNQSGNSEVSYNTSRRNITTDMILSCNGFQETHTTSCSLNLDVPYSPKYENHSFFEPADGSSISLTVILGSNSSSTRASSMQILPATFTWYNGSSLAAASDGRVTIFSNESFSQMTLSQVTVSDSGTYYCLAENLMGAANFSFLISVQPNPDTTISTTTTKPVTGPNEPSGSGGLSSGAIAGIVIGAVALIVLIGVTVYCVQKNKKGKKYESNSRTDGAGSEQGVPSAMPMNDTAQKGDINYAVLNFNNNQQAKPPADSPGAPEMLYAQVKKQ